MAKADGESRQDGEGAIPSTVEQISALFFGRRLSHRLDLARAQQLGGVVRHSARLRARVWPSGCSRQEMKYATENPTP